MTTTDPCPGTSYVTTLRDATGWQHVHSVACAQCRNTGRYRWWLDGRHLCGRCLTRLYAPLEGDE